MRVRTAQGDTVPVRVTYYRRKGQRRAGKRSAGVYAGLVVLGIYDRCTPALAAEVSLFAAMLGSLQEAQDVLANRGVALDTKTIRTIAYRYAARARLMQQVEHTAFEDTVAGRRVVISSDGGRLRLRETKRGPKTKKGRRRYTGAWREPKVLLVDVVDAEGKRDATFVPVMDATLKGPDAVFALLRTYLQRLEITQADQVLFIADGAPWIWKRVPLLVQALGLAAAQVEEVTQRLECESARPVAHPTASLPATRPGGAGHCGRAGDLSRPQQQGDPHAAGLLHQESEPHGICQARRHEASYRERSD